MYDLGLKDKVILITGGSDGLGYASAELLSSEEAHVVICGRRGDYLNEKAKIITEKTIIMLISKVYIDEGCRYSYPGRFGTDSRWKNLVKCIFWKIDIFGLKSI